MISHCQLWIFLSFLLPRVWEIIALVSSDSSSPPYSMFLKVSRRYTVFIGNSSSFLFFFYVCVYVCPFNFVSKENLSRFSKLMIAVQPESVFRCISIFCKRSKVSWDVKMKKWNWYKYHLIYKAHNKCVLAQNPENELKTATPNKCDFIIYIYSMCLISCPTEWNLWWPLVCGNNSSQYYSHIWHRPNRERLIHLGIDSGKIPMINGENSYDFCLKNMKKWYVAYENKFTEVIAFVCIYLWRVRVQCLMW